LLLIIDNYDSFTHNLARYFVELGCEVEVVRNDQISIEALQRLPLTAIVISPGPCTPNESGISLAAIRFFAGKIPILGVCLGHQAIGQVFGADVVKAGDIKHGKVSTVTHSHSPLFANIPAHFQATRYHSLVLAKASLPQCLHATAWTTQGDGETEIMAIEHTKYPLWGVQFHPESLLTEYGHQLLANFLIQAKIPVSTTPEIDIILN
jgi:para-aminobenzoate synthetase component 2